MQLDCQPSKDIVNQNLFQTHTDTHLNTAAENDASSRLYPSQHGETVTEMTRDILLQQGFMWTGRVLTISSVYRTPEDGLLL